MSQEFNNTFELPVTLANATDLRAELVSLTKHPGWVALSDLMSQQIELRRIQVFSRAVGSSREVYAQEFTKGEGVGLQIARSLPQTLIEQLNSAIERMSETEEEQDGRPDTDSSPKP